MEPGKPRAIRPDTDGLSDDHWLRASGRDDWSLALAGQVMLNVAETLAGITLVQLLKPNTPIMWGNVGSISDMRSGLFASGAVDSGCSMPP